MELSGTLKTLSFCYEQESFYNSGLNDCFSCFDDISKEDVVDIAKDLEFLPEKIESKRGWWLQDSEWPQVFIGKSPITRSRNLSVIMHKLSNRKETNLLIVAIGPKRMNYEKSLKIFKHLN